MLRARRFSTYVDEYTGRVLPPGDPLAREDFIRQHLVRGWHEDEANVRYERWRRGEIESNPIIPLRRA